MPQRTRKKESAARRTGKRFPVRLALLAAGGLLLISLILVLRSNSTLTDRYNQVRDGMTRHQVEDLLGPPEAVTLLGSARQRLMWREFPEEAMVSFHRATGADFIVDSKAFRFVGKPGWRWHIRRWFERR